MSASIRGPWVLDYLKRIAEEYGGNMASVPPRPKGVKAQILQYLTYPRSEDPDACIWAILSDKTNHIPARFTTEAMKSFRENPAFAGKTLTEHKTALVVIKDFRPFFARIPTGRDKGMSKSEHLALDVASFDLKGAYNEPMWGNPGDIETNTDMATWVAGLRQGGGAGNVLKLKKSAKERRPESPAEEIAAESMQSAKKEKPTTRQGGPSSAKGRSRQDQIDTASVPPAAHKGEAAEAPVDFAREWRNSWRQCLGERIGHIFSAHALHLLREMSTDDEGDSRGPQNLEGAIKPAFYDEGSPRHAVKKRNPLDMSSISCSSRAQESSDEEVPGTPSHWSPSVRGSPVQIADAEIEDALGDVRTHQKVIGPRSSADAQRDASSQNAIQAEAVEYMLAVSLSSYLSAPPAAQRRHQAAPSSPHLPSPSLVQMSSSAPKPSFAAVAEPSVFIQQTAGLTTQPPRPNGRRVPLPVCSRLSPDHDDTRVLVPNSDVSGSTSQSQSLSQQGPPTTSSQNGGRQWNGLYQQSLSYASESQTGSQNHVQVHSQSQPKSQQLDEVETSVAEEEPLPQGLYNQSLSYASESQGDVRAPPVLQSQPRTEAQSPGAGQATAMKAESARPAEERPSRNASALPQPVAEAAIHETVRAHDNADVDGSVTEEEEEGELDELESDSPRDVTHTQAIAGGPESLPYEEEEESDEEKDVEMHLADAGQATVGADVLHVKRPHALDVPRGLDRQEASMSSLTTDVAKSRRSSGTTWIQGATRTQTMASYAHSQDSEGPAPPSSPDVFISQESFRASRFSLPTPAPSSVRSSTHSAPEAGSSHMPLKRGVSDTVGTREVPGKKKQAGPSNVGEHDPEAWKEPSFMQRKRSAKGKERAVDVEPGSSRKSTARRKHALSSSSSESEDDHAQKRRKLSSGAFESSRAHGDLKRSVIVKTERKVGEAKGHNEVRPREIDFRRISQGASANPVSSKTPGPVKSNAASEPANGLRPTHRRSGAANTTKGKEVQFIDLSLMSRRTESSPTRRRRSLQAASAADQINVSSTSRSPLKRTEILKPPKAVRMSVGGSALGSGSKRHQKSQPVAQPLGLQDLKSSGRRMTSAPAAAVETSSMGAGPSTAAGASAAMLLGGYRPNLEMVREEGGPPLVTWDELTRILLRTGKDRFKLKKAKGKQRQE
ncbi:uncharacterized protein LAESUDRAFT_809643 [Laetiporus sulphureus 93-53]|uniref:Telomere replication protein EST3 n=1 Tax=Laetiporus sulphureus 93-53 TaxID=1314785 RepID=A0A165GRX2_9APHY|nr:uncharacterized protein LAESUDRAFT_809643 [Laetiporus sulphureus 93-53]KZT10723.1 hypothetical protein LAESUDRAFT_809643 [Laetiporus sulphureus 93-53]